jgi:hypothetical protein
MMENTKEPQDIEVWVKDSTGNKMGLIVPWDDTTDDWENHLLRVMRFLEFYVDEVVINPDQEQDPVSDEVFLAPEKEETE